MPVATWAQTDEHTDHSLEVSRVLPPELIKGPHHEVVDPVVNYFALDQFTVKSDFGDVAAYGQLDLRIKLREIQAIAALKKETKASLTAKTVLEEGKETLHSAGQVARHPVKALKGLGSGIKARFKKTVRDVKEDVELARSDAENKGEVLAGRMLGVAKARREWAEKLQIDPYTRNEVLSAELDRVATIEAGVKLGTKWLLPSIPGVSFMRDVYSLVTTMDRRELIEYNTRQLVGAGADPAKIESFLNHPHFSATAATAMVAAIAELEGVEDRLVILDQALTAESYVDALFFLESTAMAIWYHSNQQPLSAMLHETGLPAALTQDGRVVVFAAIDFPHWSEELAALMREMQDAYEDVSPRRELLLAGNAQGVFKDHIREMNWDVRINLRDEYLGMLPWAVTNGDMVQR